MESLGQGRLDHTSNEGSQLIDDSISNGVVETDVVNDEIDNLSNETTGKMEGEIPININVVKKRSELTGFVQLNLDVGVESGESGDDI